MAELKRFKFLMEVECYVDRESEAEARKIALRAVTVNYWRVYRPTVQIKEMEEITQECEFCHERWGLDHVCEAKKAATKAVPEPTIEQLARGN